MDIKHAAILSTDDRRRERASKILSRMKAMLSAATSDRKSAQTKRNERRDGFDFALQERGVFCALRWCLQPEAHLASFPVALGLYSMAASLMEGMDESLVVVRYSCGEQRENDPEPAYGKLTLHSVDAAAAYLTMVGPVVDRCLDLAVGYLLREETVVDEISDERLLESSMSARTEADLILRQLFSVRYRSAVIEAATQVVVAIIKGTNQQIHPNFLFAPFISEESRRWLYFALGDDRRETCFRAANLVRYQMLGSLAAGLRDVVPDVWLAAHTPEVPYRGRGAVC